MVDNTFDTIVVGSGLAGIVTALELLDRGQKVLLLDRSGKEKFGGLATWSFGGIFLVNSKQQKKAGIQDSEDLALRDWHSFAQFDEQDEIPKLWAKQYIQYSRQVIPQWLEKRKVKLFPVVHWVERGLYAPGNSVPRFHMIWGTGKGLIDALEKSLFQHPKVSNLTLHFGHMVEDFEITNGKIEGVRGTFEEKEFYYKAPNIVLATGGITGNIDLVKRFWPKDFGSPPLHVLNGAHPEGDGLMHSKVQEHGGNLTHLDRMWHYAAGIAHPRPLFEDHGLSLVPPKSALWMNYKGRRIGPAPLITGFDTRFLVEQVCKQEHKYSWQILNYKIALKELAISGAEFNPAIREKNLFKFIKTILIGNKELVEDMLQNSEDFIMADTIEELMDKMEEKNYGNPLDREGLLKDIRDYDEQIARGQPYLTDDQLRRIHHSRLYKGDRVRTCKYQKILDPKAKPYIAIREHILSRKSLGGIKTDLSCRVLDGQNKPIDGLLSVGEAAGFGGGGVHGHRSLEGTFLGGCIATGIIAAETLTR